MRRWLTFMAVTVGSALPAAPAGAVPVPGYGEPFATAFWVCPDTAVASDPVAGDHPDAMVRVTFDERPDGRVSAPSIDLGDDPFIHDTPEYYGVTGERWWWPAGSIAAGTRLREIPECQGDDVPSFTGKAEYFDRPATPFTFSDPTVQHASSPSILGFVASQAGEYVADVSVTGARLTIHNPDLEIGDNAQNLGGTWDVQYEAPAGAPGPTVTAQLPLGHLNQGLHDLPYRLLDLSTAPGEHFAITIRLAQSDAPPQTAPPPSQEPAPSTPSPSPSPGIVVAGIQRSGGAVRVTAAGATALVRRALRSRLRGWKVTTVACRRGSDARASCTFAARRRGSRLTGSGAVTRRPSGTALRYTLTARIARSGCRAVGARHCSRRAIWSG